MFDVQVKVPPTAEPVSLPDAKLWSNISHDEDDAQLLFLITSAREHVENILQRSLSTRTLTVRAPCFWATELDMPGQPLQSVTHIKYTDPDDVVQTIDPLEYEVNIYSSPGMIRPVKGSSWPDVADTYNAVEIEIVAGNLSMADIPAQVRHAINMLVDHWYEHRGAASEIRLTEPPIRIINMLWPYRAWG